MNNIDQVSPTGVAGKVPYRINFDLLIYHTWPEHICYGQHSLYCGAIAKISSVGDFKTTTSRGRSAISARGGPDEARMKENRRPDRGPVRAHPSSAPVPE